MNKIIFIPTWICNQRCSYCDYNVTNVVRGTNGRLVGYDLEAFGRKHSFFAELSWDKWIKYLEPHAPYHLDITGGEPLLYPEIEHLLQHLEFRSKWSITSNTLNTDVIKKMAFFNCDSWTASFHYKNEAIFTENLIYLLKHGAKVRVTLVLTPDNESEVIRCAVKFTKHCYGVNIHPLLKQGFSWDDTEKKRDIYNKFLDLHDGSNIIFADIKSDFNKYQQFNKCDAGNEYFVLLPDGKIWRCYSQILQEDNAIYSHISNAKTAQGKTPCDIGRCVFPCDLKYPDKE